MPLTAVAVPNLDEIRTEIEVIAKVDLTILFRASLAVGPCRPSYYLYPLKLSLQRSLATSHRELVVY